MTAVQRIDEQPAEVTDYSGGLLQVIDRAARDPNTNVENMERLFALYERAQARSAEVAFSQAFAELQPELPTISKNGQIVHNNKVISEFSDWPNINKVIKPILSQFGFGLSFKPVAPQKAGNTALTATLRHRLGFTDEATIELPTDTSGAKNAVQGVGSSLTYAKRYAGVLILNLTIDGEDDDGAAAAPMVQHEAPRDRPFPQGPAKNKTELKAKGRDLWRDVEACGDVDQLDILLNDNRALIEQIKEGLPSWWTGYQKDGQSYDGLDTVINRVRRECQAGEAR